VSPLITVECDVTGACRAQRDRQRPPFQWRPFEERRLVVKRSNYRLQSLDKVLILVIRLIVALTALVTAVSRLRH
jgi:hypothetical protein